MRVGRGEIDVATAPNTPAFGGAVFAAFIDARRPRAPLTTAALLAALVATALAVGLQGADALGVPLAGLARAVVWRTGFETSFGATAAR